MRQKGNAWIISLSLCRPALGWRTAETRWGWLEMDTQTFAIVSMFDRMASGVAWPNYVMAIEAGKGRRGYGRRAGRRCLPRSSRLAHFRW